MRKMCPNFDKVDGLETVIEVPIPEEMLGGNGFNRWQNIRTLMNTDKSSSSLPSNNEFLALLKLVGAPLIPLQVQSDNTLTRPLRDCSIVSTQNQFRHSETIHISLISLLVLCLESICIKKFQTAIIR